MLYQLPNNEILLHTLLVKKKSPENITNKKKKRYELFTQAKTKKAAKHGI